MGDGWSRRRLLRLGMASAAAAVAGAGLSAATSAQSSRADTKIHLVVSIAYQGAGVYQGVPQQLVDEYIAAHWTSKHPGVTVTTVAGMGCNGTCLTAGQEVAASLAGNPTDIVAGCCDMIAQYYAADLLVPLDPYIRRDNVDLSDFSPGHLAALHSEQGQMALPEYDDPCILLVNEGMLDELGLPYPQPGWTYEDATKLWHDATHKQKTAKVAGIGLYLQGWDTNDIPQWLVRGWGGSKYSPDGTRAQLNSRPVFEAVSWAAGLVQSGVAINGAWSTYVGNKQAAMCMSGGGDVQGSVVHLRGFKWNYYPMPAFPAGRPSTFINNDFYGINQYSRQPRDLVWDMFKFITMDNGLARLMYRTQFITPNRKSMWPDWIELVRTVAPVLQRVNLESKVQALDYGWSTDFMRYEPLQAQAIEAKHWADILSRRVGVLTGLEQASRQMNALEALGPALQAAQSRQLQTYFADVRRAEAAKGPIEVPAPSRAGLQPAKGLVRVDAARGVYTLTGDGGGGVNGSGDNCVFAATAWTKSRGTFTCRLVSLRPGRGTAPSGLRSGAKVGLMARDTLGSTAASVGLEFALGRGLHYHERALDGDPLFVDNHAGTSPGLLAQSAVQRSSVAPGGDLLLQPVWLRLVLNVNEWTPYTSLDGLHWVAAGAPTPVEFLGAWVGLFASSHTAGKQIVAVFDRVSGFRPDTFVQIGAA